MTLTYDPGMMREIFSGSLRSPHSQGSSAVDHQAIKIGLATMMSVSSGQHSGLLTSSRSARTAPFVAFLFCLLTIVLASATIAFWPATPMQSAAPQVEKSQASLIATFKKAPLSHCRRTAETSSQPESQSREDLLVDGLVLETPQLTSCVQGAMPALPPQLAANLHRQFGPSVGSRAPPDFS